MKTTNFTILIVEDDPNDQLLTQRAFRHIGVTAPIQVVNNGAEAIAKMEKESSETARNFNIPHSL